MAATAKTAYLAEQSVLQFVGNHAVVFYWTFTFQELVLDKEEAEKRFRPLVDLFRRRGAKHLAFWEPQKRGAWHVHLLTDKYFDVVWLRPWLMKRGWGPQMKVKVVQKGSQWVQGKGWVTDDSGVRRLCWYLRKYLTKSLSASTDGKKAFGGSVAAKAGTTRFKWNPRTDNPLSYLYFYGARLYRELHGENPRWRGDCLLNSGLFSLLIRMGYEYTDYGSFDPFFFWSG